MEYLFILSFPIRWDNQLLGIILIDAYTAHGTTVTVGQNRGGRQVMALWRCESEIVDSTKCSY